MSSARRFRLAMPDRHIDDLVLLSPRVAGAFYMFLLCPTVKDFVLAAS